MDAGEFFTGLLLEGDRAAAVLGAARIDVALEKLLKAVMSHHPGGSDNLFDSDRPLGTFFAKIALPHRLGLIDDDFEHALQMLRKIRNDFAHSVVKTSFSESSHRNRIIELARVAKKLKSDSGESFQAYFARIVPAHIGSPELRDFCASVFVLLIALELTSGNTKRFVPGAQARFL